MSDLVENRCRVLVQDEKRGENRYISPIRAAATASSHRCRMFGATATRSSRDSVLPWMVDAGGLPPQNRYALRKPALRRHPSAVQYFSAGSAGLSLASSAAAVNNARLLVRSTVSEK